MLKPQPWSAREIPYRAAQRNRILFAFGNITTDDVNQKCLSINISLTSNFANA